MMNKAAILLFFAGLYILSAKAQQKQTGVIYKFGDFLIHAKDSMKIDLIENGTHPKNLKSKGDTLYAGNKYVILGDIDKMAFYETFGVFRKYKIHYEFSNYPVSVYKGRLAVPDFKTDIQAYFFRTQIRYQCKRAGVNFAGHYTLVHWGCGSECETIALVDRIDGRIYYSSIKWDNDKYFYTQRFKPNSKLLVMNDWMLEGFKGYVRCSSPNADWKVTFAEWNSNKLIYLPQ